MDQLLNGKVAIITGAGGALGGGTARGLAKALVIAAILWGFPWLEFVRAFWPGGTQADDCDWRRAVVEGHGRAPWGEPGKAGA